MTLLVAACGGFLLAVLWMDLMFDTQALAQRNSAQELPDETLTSIAGYYRRATTTSRPMSALIATVMAVLLGALAFRLASGHYAVWLVVALAVLAIVPIFVALIRTVPNAVRLGRRSDTATAQTRLAREILGDHLLCFAMMLAFVVLLLSTS
ncbi:MAG TPA: hypothetical protein VH496_03935 [Mycobacterium sp.]